MPGLNLGGQPVNLLLLADSRAYERRGSGLEKSVFNLEIYNFAALSTVPKKIGMVFVYLTP